MGLYSRFGGKDGVVDELYAEGFERLVDGDEGQPADRRHRSPTSAACATCYRETALANATHYMVMFGGAVPGFVPSDASHELAHDAFGGLVAKVARCTDAGVLVGSPDEIAEVLWGSIHGLVMLELVGINPLMSDPGARFARALDALFDGFCTWLTSHHAGAGVDRRRARPGLRRAVRRPQRRRSSRISWPRARSASDPARRPRTSPPSSPRPTPMARRALAVATKSAKFATKAPLPSSKAIKIGLASIPVALRLSTTTRHGIRELQLLASYVIWRLRGLPASIPTGAWSAR